MGDIVLYTAALLLPLTLGGCLFGLVRSFRRKRPRSRWASLLAANALLFLLLCSILFLALESYYRFWHDATDSFAQTRVSSRWFERHYHANNAGFRDNVHYQFSRTPGRRRVSFVGDSFTAGHGIANVEDRFANRVRLMKKGQWEVHVLAEVGRDTGAELKLIDDLIRNRYQFDIVVLVYCLNDVNDMVPDQERISERSTDLGSPGFLVEHSFLINTYYYRIKARFDPDVANYYGSVRGAYDGPIWDEQQERLRLFRDMCQGAGGRLMVVTFPFLQSLGPDYEYRSAHAKLSRFWKDLNVPHLDLLPMFERHTGEKLTVNRYDAHPNERAHALAAESIMQFLERQN